MFSQSRTVVWFVFETVNHLVETTDDILCECQSNWVGEVVGGSGESK